MLRTLAIGLAVMAAAPAQSADLSVEDRASLMQLADLMDRAWTAADVKANAALFTADATARFGEDPLGNGREAIRTQFESFFKDRPAGLRHVTAIERIQSLGPRLAMWDAEVRVERREDSGGWQVLTRIRNVTIAARQADGWRVQAVRAFPVTR